MKVSILQTKLIFLNFHTAGRFVFKIKEKFICLHCGQAISKNMTVFVSGFFFGLTILISLNF